MRGCRRLVGQLEDRCIHIAPVPFLTRLVGANYGMLGLVKVSRRMATWRTVAASDMAAFLADSKMHPVLLSRLKAVFTAPR